MCEMSRELEISFVKTLGEKVGYGSMMQIAEKLWREKLEKDGMGGGELKVGCCASLTVPCGCKAGCDWCGGCGWLTKKCKTEKVLAEYLEDLRRKFEEDEEVPQILPGPD